MPTPGKKHIRQLNEPSPLKVSSDAQHHPLAVHVAGNQKAVSRVADTWIVEDEWWRDPPIDRQYFKIVLDDGQIITMFRDRHANTWFEQDYTHPDMPPPDPYQPPRSALPYENMRAIAAFEEDDS